MGIQYTLSNAGVILEKTGKKSLSCYRIRTKTVDRTVKMAVQMPLLTANIVRRCKSSAVLAEQVSDSHMIGISRLLF